MDRRTIARWAAALVVVAGCQRPIYQEGLELPCLYKIRPGQYGSLKQSIEHDLTAPYITTAEQAEENAKPKEEKKPADEPAAPAVASRQAAR